MEMDLENGQNKNDSKKSSVDEQRHVQAQSQAVDCCNSLPGPSSASSSSSSSSFPPSATSSVTAAVVSSLDDAYEFVKAQEESGFGDPLIGNDDNFDIYQYIGADDTPESGSPAAFGGATVCNNNNNSHLIYQQQQHQLLNAATSELAQALHVPAGGVGAVHQQQQHPHHHRQQLLKGVQHNELHQHHHHHQQQQHHVHQQQQQHHLQQQQAMVLDNVGLMMYSNNNGGCAVVPENGVGAVGRMRGVIETRGGGGGGQTRLLPDSPPITDASGGASSISPGSSGGASSSPFSPDHYHYVHPQEMNGAAAGEVLLIQQHPRGEMLLMNQHHHHNNQMGSGHHQMMGVDGRASATECLHSPNSEFLSPYPPSQSTPGSHHSAQQISPPALPHPPKGGGLSYLLQSQSANTFVASMDNLYTATSPDEMTNGNEAVTMVAQHQQQQQHFGNGNNNNHSSASSQGMKRRRMSSSAATPGSRDSSMPLGNSTNLPNIKSGAGGGGGANGATAHGNGKSPQHHQQPPNAAADQQQQQQQQQRMLLLQTQQQQTPQPQQQHSHHQSFDELDENINSQRTIKFEPYIREQWNALYDFNRRPLQPMPIAVVADKGFNYSASDNCFVNQKKNHFQITVNIGVDLNAVNSSNASNNVQQISPFTPHFVCVNGELLEVLDNVFFLSFCGVKSEMQSTEISIKQSQADRKPINHDPESFKIDGTSSSVRQTVARLHFGETTMNNHRKNGKPNPEQKYFLLVVKLLAKTQHGTVLIQSFHSDRVIVRASNPGQFEQPDQELNWRQGQQGSLTFPGQVCIGVGANSDKPLDHNATLSVFGNIATTGNITRPSDRRVKEDIADVSTAEAMARVAQMRLVEFAYKPDIAQRWGLTEQDRHRVGVIAQELAEVLPEAVKDNGEFLTVDDTRVFYDTVAAAQELYRLTGNLGSKLDQVEKISQKLARYAQKRRQLGSMASGLSDFSTFFGTKSIADGAAIGGAASLAGDKQSCVSYSRTSLASAVTTLPATTHCDNDDGDMEQEKAKKNGGGRSRRSSSDRYHHRCRSYSSASAYCSRSHYGGGGGGGGGPCTVVDSPLCNSKFTQGTIVTLVIIMALCLVTMCTLYVMDWYNRTYVFPVRLIDPYMPHHHHQSPSSSDSGTDRGRPPQQQIEPGKMIKPFVEWKLPDRPQNVPPLSVFCGGAGTTMLASLSSLLPVPLVGHGTCPNYCCSSNNKLAPPQENFGEKLSKSVDEWVALASKVAENVVPPAPQLLLTKDHQQQNGVGPLNTLANGANFEVLNMNFTIDARYCFNESCDARNGYFNLFVPVSEHFPTIPLQIRISTDDSTLFVDDCGGLPGFQHKPCQQLQLEDDTERSQPPETNRVAENIFELSAGSFLQSAYRFRIGHSANLCQRDERQRGRAFDEYNLFFYRTCALQTATEANGAATTTTTGQNEEEKEEERATFASPVGGVAGTA